MTRELRTAINNVQETLATAHSGVVQARSNNPVQRRIGIRNAIVFGRAVTFALQKLRSIDSRFDSWYRPWQERMKKDERFKYLSELRNLVEKEGILPTSATMSTNHLDMGLLMAVVAPTRPPGAKDFFLGDSLGGCGWTVINADGHEEKFYVPLPYAPMLDVTFDIHFGDGPDSLKNVSAVKICCDYIYFLDELVKDAKRYFLAANNN